MTLKDELHCAFVLGNFLAKLDDLLVRAMNFSMQEGVVVA